MLGRGARAVFVALSASCAGLGIWQDTRRRAKVELVAQRRDRLQHSESQPIESVAQLPSLAPDECLGVRLGQGCWLSQPLMIMGPRGPPLARQRYGHTGQMGCFLISPYQLASGEIILVNRGWAQLGPHLDAMVFEEENQVTSGQVLECIVHRPIISDRAIAILPRTITFEPPIKNSQSKSLELKQWTLLNLQGLFREYVEWISHRRRVNIDPHFESRLSEPAPATEYARIALHRESPLDFLQFATSPEKHLAYEMTWFALSFFAISVALRKVRPR